ncbi:MAG: FAD-dependent oxidoreductase [Saccharofermentanales bacterium]
MQSFSVNVDRKAIAQIDGYRCVNCGICEEYCPTGALKEYQKTVCHLCPDCTEIKSMSVNQMEELKKESCTLACPVGISPQGYINLLKCGKIDEAYDLIWEKNPLPSVCGSICHHPCEDVCKRGTLVDSPIKIRALKRYLSENKLDDKVTPYPVIHQEEIAVIGGGPAGLTAAHVLAKRGYKVTVYEAAAEAGGMLLKGIPSFRLDKDIVRKEVKRLEESGIKFVFGAKVRPTDIEKDYDKIIVATGNSISKGLPIANSVCKGVMNALDFMTKVNSGDQVTLYGNVVVIGGGSVAMDTARTALRLGADKVTVICLECGSQIPAHPWEIEETQEEGIQIISGVAPLRFEAKDNAPPHCLSNIVYTTIENLDCKTITYDPIGEEMVLSADFAIIATGQRAEPQYITGDNIILAGDIVNDTPSVIDAMGSGHDAAIQIDKELRGREWKEYELEREMQSGDPKYRIYPAVRLKKAFPEIRKIKDRSGFDMVEQLMSDEEALLETWRCLECGYREVDIEKCIGCGVCMRVCPKGDVITMVPVEEQGGNK